MYSVRISKSKKKWTCEILRDGLVVASGTSNTEKRARDKALLAMGVSDFINFSNQGTWKEE